MSSYAEFQERWEQEAGKERQRYDTRPIPVLLDEINRGSYGQYYQIWYSIADRATAAQAGWVLFEALKRPIDYLYRYHCAAALLKLMQLKEFEPVELTSRPKTPENLAQIEQILAARLGPPPARVG